MNQTSRAKKGFTLIELVVAIVLLAILGTAVSKFIVFGSEVYTNAARQQSLLSASRFVVERLSRELRASIPNSIVTFNNDTCIKFRPIKASGAYRTDVSATTAPISPASNANIDVISWSGSYAANDSFYIYATSVDDIYNNVDQVAAISSVAVTTGQADPLYTVTFSTSDSFTDGSPNERYYTADSTVFFCLSAGSIYRYEVSGADSGESAATAVTVANNGVLMAENLTNASDEGPFAYREGTLLRNSVVNLYLEFSATEGENMFFNQEVHIPNVP